jgi:hypothetical protein
MGSTNVMITKEDEMHAMCPERLDCGSKGSQAFAVRALCDGAHRAR